MKRDKPPRPTPTPAVADTSVYRVPHHAAPIDLWLHSNEGASPPPGLLSVVTDTEVLRRYPSARELEQFLAERHGLSTDEVLVTAGADDALDRAFRALLSSKRDLILPEPTFVMLRRFARLVGAEVRSVPWPSGPYPAQAVIERVTKATGAIMVVSPNNPTGAVCSISDLQKLSRAAPHAAVLVDLAYTEFADVDLTKAALELPNAVVFRTLSKAWGLAGLRLGYALGPPELIAWLRAAGNPYAASGLSIAVALAALKGGHDPKTYVARARAERESIENSLRELGADVGVSQGNFAFARLPSPGRARWLADALAGLGIRIRAFPDTSGLRDAVRITCPGDPSSAARLITALATALSPARIRLDERLASAAEWHGLAAQLTHRAPVETCAGPLDASTRGSCGWYIADQPALIRSARDLGHVGIGLCPDPNEHDSFFAAGAARVLRSLSQLAEVDS